MKRTTITLDDNNHKLLKLYAINSNISKVVNELIEKYLKSKPQRKSIAGKYNFDVTDEMIEEAKQIWKSR